MADTAGKWSETTDADEEIQRICNQVKAKVEEKTHKKYAVFTAVKYRTLLGIVGASHYLIKVHVGDADYIHLYVIIGIFLNAPPTLKGVQQNKTKDDPLEPF